MAMHIDYARELVERYEADSFIKGDAGKILDAVVEESEILKLVERVGDEKHRSIATTMRDIIQAPSRRRGNFRKTTAAQQQAVIAFLLEQYGTARAVLAAAFDTTELAMFGEVVDAPAPATADENAASRQAAREAENQKSAAHNAFIGAPKLKGSVKQIAWAETLRAKMIVLLEEDGYSNDQIMQMISDREALKASFWIDNRDLLARDEALGDGAELFVELLQRPLI